MKTTEERLVVIEEGLRLALRAFLDSGNTKWLPVAFVGEVLAALDGAPLRCAAYVSGSVAFDPQRCELAFGHDGPCVRGRHED